MFVFDEPTSLCFLFFEYFFKAITDISDIGLNPFSTDNKNVLILCLLFNLFYNTTPTILK